MNRSEDIFLHHSVGNHDSILVVITLPRHEGHEHVATQCQLTLAGSITLGQHIALLHLVASSDDRFLVDAGVLVGSSEFLQHVSLHIGVERNQSLGIGAVVADDDLQCIGIFHHTFALSAQHSAGVESHTAFETGTHDRHFGIQQRNCLTHHVRSHQRTVSIVVFKERNQGCSDRSDLVSGHINQVHLFLRNDRIVGQVTHLHIVFQHMILIHRRGCLSDIFFFFFLCTQINRILVEHHFTVHHAAVRSLDKAQMIDLGEHAERGNQTDVRSFRSFNGTQTTIVGVVNVTHLETGTVTGQTARTQSGDSSLVGQL